MDEKKIAMKNYIIIILIFVATIGLTLYFCSCYRVYSESKKEIPIIRGTLSEITSEDLDHYIMENQSTVIYVCTASDPTCRNYEKNFKKGLAIGTKIEYNVADVCKRDEAADCSLAGEGTVADHVRQSDDGSRIRHAGQQPSKSYLSTNKEEKKWPARKSASSSGPTSTASLTRLPSASSRPRAAPAPRCPARSRSPRRRKS